MSELDQRPIEIKWAFRFYDYVDRVEASIALITVDGAVLGVELDQVEGFDRFSLFPLSPCCRGRLTYTGVRHRDTVRCLSCSETLDAWQGQTLSVTAKTNSDMFWDRRVIEKWLELLGTQIFEATLVSLDLATLAQTPWPDPAVEEHLVKDFTWVGWNASLVPSLEVKAS